MTDMNKTIAAYSEQLKNPQIRAHFDMIGSDWRSNALFTPRFLSENRFTLFGKRSKAA